MTRWWICFLLAVHLTSSVQSKLTVYNDVFSVDGCGIRKPLKRMLHRNGSQPSPGEWPWHAGLFHWINEAYPVYACGGSIIASSYILTAAHCTYMPSKVRPLEASELLVRVGLTNLQKLEHSLQQNTIAEIIRHGQFKNHIVENNIALLRLTREVQMTDYVSPICLWSLSESQSIIVKKEGYVAGWGLDESHELLDELKQAEMSVVSDMVCLKSDRDFYGGILDEGTFCAGFTNGTLGMGCSGGGLYIEVGGQWMLRGIISAGKLKIDRTYGLDTTSYVVFTDVGYYIPWIQRSMEMQAVIF